MKTLGPVRGGLRTWPEIAPFENRLSRVFGMGLPSMFVEEPNEWVPVVNLIEANGEYQLTAELPGLAPEDVDVDVEDNILTVRGEKVQENIDNKEGRWHLTERMFGAFERSFTLPRTVDPTLINAEVAEGLLTVHLPKREGVSGRRVEVKGKGKSKPIKAKK